MSPDDAGADESGSVASILAGGGEMGALARTIAWANTPLGDVRSWPQSLRTVVSIVFESTFPMMLAWGPAFTQIYNDPFRPILGTTKHPAAMGQGTAETFAEAWHIVGPLFAQVMGGQGVGFDDMLVPLDRDGYLEECYFVYTYTPVRDESGGVGGLLVACTETSARVVAERRLRALRELASAAAEARDEDEAWGNAAAVLADKGADLPFALLYVLEIDADTARLIHPTSSPWGPDRISIDGDALWPLRRGVDMGGPQVVDDVAARVGAHAGPIWPEPVRAAVIVPITRPGLPQPYGFLVAGASPRLALDDRYLDFLSLVGDQIATGVAKARIRAAEQRHTERLDHLFAQAPMAIAVLRGPDHVFEFANPPYVKLVGNRPVTGMPIREAFPELARQGIWDLLDDVRQTGVPFVGRSVRVNLTRGDDRTLEDAAFDFVYQPVLDAQGRVDSIVVVAHDVTELARAKDAAEASNRHKDEFLATLSHELRTPLNAVLGYVQMLRGGMITADRVPAVLETVERNALLQQQLVEDVLDVSRIITGKFRLDVQSVNLARVIGDAIETVLPAANAKGVRLQMIVDESGVEVAGDAQRLQQVIWNVLSNAVKFTPRGGRVQIRLQLVNADVEISVSDTGEGVAAEMLSHLFDRFWQADSTLSRSHGGLGLGLAISRHLVEAHGGTIEATSPGKGKGTTVSIKLPCLAAKSADAG